MPGSTNIKNKKALCKADLVLSKQVKYLQNCLKNLTCLHLYFPQIFSLTMNIAITRYRVSANNHACD